MRNRGLPRLPLRVGTFGFVCATGLTSATRHIIIAIALLALAVLAWQAAEAGSPLTSGGQALGTTVEGVAHLPVVGPIVAAIPAI